MVVVSLCDFRLARLPIGRDRRSHAASDHDALGPDRLGRRPCPMVVDRRGANLTTSRLASSCSTDRVRGGRVLWDECRPRQRLRLAVSVRDVPRASDRNHTYRCRGRGSESQDKGTYSQTNSLARDPSLRWFLVNVRRTRRVLADADSLDWACGQCTHSRVDLVFASRMLSRCEEVRVSLPSSHGSVSLVRIQARRNPGECPVPRVWRGRTTTTLNM